MKMKESHTNYIPTSKTVSGNDSFAKVYYWECRAKLFNGYKPTCSGNCEFCYYGIKKSRLYDINRLIK